MRWYNVSSLVYKSVLGLFLCVLWASCGTVKEVPVETKIEYREIVRDSLIYVEVPVEKIVEVVPDLDTLNLETSVAKARAYLDKDKRQLKGELENKPVKLEKEIQILETEKEVIKEVPVEVIVEKKTKYIPKFYKFCLIWFIGSILFIAVKIYLKFH